MQGEEWADRAQEAESIGVTSSAQKGQGFQIEKLAGDLTMNQSGEEGAWRRAQILRDETRSNRTVVGLCGKKKPH